MAFLLLKRRRLRYFLNNEEATIFKETFEL